MATLDFHFGALDFFGGTLNSGWTCSYCYYHDYKYISKYGCKKFKLNDKKNDPCDHYGEDQYETENSLHPALTIKMISIGDHLSNTLCNEEFRDMFLYRSSRVTKNNVYQDIFESGIYKSLKQQNLFNNDLDIALALFIYGFTTQIKGKGTMTIIHYTQKNSRFSSVLFLAHASQRISISYNQLWMKSWISVNLLMATGDTPDVDDLMHHGTHASLYGCRFCKEKGRHAENRNHGMCFVSTTAP
ncbi:hypothetical protein AB4K20DRAFT_1868932 [Rhizopus microsporus]|uniref:Uncharacterized protein n=1 Tax=Rhizopus microsporus TaxID=58291 RepID=A0A1X0S861_RHIZD|nr:hypothetical protein BCV71DRAFT_233221 [Rhizopus microsporus]